MFSYVGFLVCFYLVYEVTYVMDRIAYLAADVGFGTRVWRGGEFSPHSPGGRTRGSDHQRSSRTPRRLAPSKPSSATTDMAGRRSSEAKGGFEERDV